eukprot:759747-Hanusia_phi.AAC.3
MRPGRPGYNNGRRRGEGDHKDRQRQRQRQRQEKTDTGEEERRRVKEGEGEERVAICDCLVRRRNSVQFDYSRYPVCSSVLQTVGVEPVSSCVVSLPGTGS